MSLPNRSPGAPLLPQIKRQTTSQRPRPPTIEEVITAADRTPLRTPTHKDHKAGFRGIFRSKSHKENQAIPEAPPNLFLHSVKTSSKPRTNSPTPSDRLESKAIFARSNAGIASEGKPVTTKSKKQKRGSSVPTKSSKATLLPPNTCDTLPLFQVYPRSIKHGKLVSSTLPADTIIRIGNANRSNGLMEDSSQSVLEEEGTDGSKTLAKKGEKSRSKNTKHMSGSVSVANAEWTDKIYVLVTSGFLLQYAGDGAHDRLPEKSLQLCKDSVCFASDAIEGKHWVLQVSQSIDSNGMPVPDCRPLLSRLSFRSADSRRMTASFLLILENAEEMHNWISVIRREIEALGGKKHTSETGQLDEEPFKDFTSPRTVPRDLNPSFTAVTPPLGTSEEQLMDGLVNIASQLSGNRPSLDCPSVSTTATSMEELFLADLRENSHHRLSELSSEPTTIGTSRGSSPTCSPTQDTFPTAGRMDAIPILKRRRSEQLTENSTVGLDSEHWMTASQNLQSRRSRPHSTMQYTDYKLAEFRPNEISNASGWRSLGNSKLPKSSDTWQNSPEPNLLSTRKRAPIALVLAKRPLTPVERSPSFSCTTHVYIPREDASRMSQLGSPNPRSDSPRPQSASSVTTMLQKSASFSNRLPSQAAAQPSDPKQFELLRSPPVRPPPPPPQLLCPQTTAQVLDAITNLQAPPSPSLKVTSEIQFLRRPLSMQMRVNGPPPVSLHTQHSAYSGMYQEVANPRLPPRKMSPLLSPGFSPTQLSTPKVQNRRSMPRLASAPLAPPPTCALPPLPCSVTSGRG